MIKLKDRKDLMIAILEFEQFMYGKTEENEKLLKKLKEVQK